MSDSDVAKNFDDVLEKVRRGADVIVHHDRQAVAILHSLPPTARKISECMRLMSHSTAVMDADFARDVQDAIDSHREPLEAPGWD
jgi:hypothetical protein